MNQAGVMPMDVTAEQIAAYQRDGALVLRGVFRGWIETLCAGVAANMASPGPFGTENVRPEDGGGSFFDDYCNWQRIQQFSDFVHHSPAAMIAGRLMGSSSAQMFHDHVLVKEPHTPKKTPWHQDMPYYCVNGMQTASYWIPLDPVNVDNTLRLVLGSHLWPRLLRPRRWAGGDDFYADTTQFMDLPDVEDGCFRILEPELEPGDAILFNYRTVHGANGNAGPHRRRAFSCRFLGDDAVFIERPGRTSPPYPGINQKSGERLREDWFPTIWRG